MQVGWFERISTPFARPPSRALIREAAKQIDLAAYVLKDSAVIEALREASEEPKTLAAARAIA
jgi:hypothetical protein